MKQTIIILNFLALTIVNTCAQTVYIDIDSGKIVGVDDGRRTQANQPNQQFYPNRGGQRQMNYPYQQRFNPGNQQRYGYPSQQYQGYQPGAQANSLNAEWVCRNTATGDTMIIASGPDQKQPQFPNSNSQTPYPDNPWLRPENPVMTERPVQPTPNRIPQPVPTAPPTRRPFPSLDEIVDTSSKRPFPSLDEIVDTSSKRPFPSLDEIVEPTPPPPPSTSSKGPLPSLDDIDWTMFLDKTTEKPGKIGKLSEAIDGEGIIQARIN